ncbi:hypothetical protein AB8Z38_29365 [Bradyrhizobium sp. LLZ17]|uniref:Uncharacterized protein n=1 Tax=Bradyrhizobium sp. LLZ17 TaxID=3239388 RepID=A0AB39XFD5_9BRAD
MASSSEPIKPIEDVRDISAITYGFMASKALFAAIDFDLFTLRGRDRAGAGPGEGDPGFPRTGLSRCLHPSSR